MDSFCEYDTSPPVLGGVNFLFLGLIQSKLQRKRTPTITHLHCASTSGYAKVFTMFNFSISIYTLIFSRNSLVSLYSLDTLCRSLDIIWRSWAQAVCNAQTAYASPDLDRHCHELIHLSLLSRKIMPSSPVLLRSIVITLRRCSIFWPMSPRVFYLLMHSSLWLQHLYWYTLDIDVLHELTWKKNT